MEISEQIFEAEEKEELEFIRMEAENQRDSFYNSLANGFIFEEYEECFKSLAKMNILNKKLIHCDERLKEFRDF